MVQIKLVLLASNLRKACIIQEQFQAKLNVWRTTTKTFFYAHRLASQALAVCFNMSQKIAKLWGLSALATNCYLDKFTVITNILRVRMIFENDFIGLAPDML